MAQFIRPISDITKTAAWTGSYTDIDEVSASDSDFIWTEDRTAGTYECGLTTGAGDPLSAIDHTIRIRHSKCDGGVPNNNDGNAQTFSAYLYEGTTLIATLASDVSCGLWADLSYTLTSGEANNITDYDNLRIRIEVPTGPGGPGANRRGCAISWAEMEFPVAPPTDYTTNYDKGSFLLGGKVVDLLRDWTLASAKGSFALTGKVITFSKGYTLEANKGGFTLSGKVATLLFKRNLASSKGSFILDGKDIGLSYGKTLFSSKGSFLLDGKVIALTKDSVLASSKGSFVLDGKVASLIWIQHRTITALKGNFSLTGKDVDLIYGLDVDATLVYNTRRVLHNNKILIYNGN